MFSHQEEDHIELRVHDFPIPDLIRCYLLSGLDHFDGRVTYYWGNGVLMACVCIGRDA